jgi:hypothetical protein
VLLLEEVGEHDHDERRPVAALVLPKLADSLLNLTVARRHLELDADTTLAGHDTTDVEVNLERPTMRHGSPVRARALRGRSVMVSRNSP